MPSMVVASRALPSERRDPDAMSPRALYWASQATMCVSIAIFFYECFAYNNIFLKTILPAVGKENMVPVFRVLFNSVWIMGLWSYHQAHWTDPGAVPERWLDFVTVVGESLPISPSRPEWQPGKATLCKKCQAARPERSHHCMLCGVCVLRMDHHCPWINNCVGFHNHKYFLLLGIYAWLASLIGLGTSLPELWRFVGIVLRIPNAGGFEGMPLEVSALDIWAFLTFGLFAFLIALLLTSLLSTHLPLAMSNMTTIEDFYENMPNPYEQGGRVSNLAQVFGRPGLDWFLPVRPCRPISDGISYPKMEQLDGHFQSLTLVDGVALLEDQGPAMLHQENADCERTWRIRYRVRSPEEMKAMGENGNWHFWACGNGGRE